MRLDKLLANMGCGSRKDVKKLVRRGAVCVNGAEAEDAGMSIDENSDTVTVFGREILYKKYVYLMMNKPAGVLSATEDYGRKTVATDLIGDDFSHYELSPAGRLDIDSEGFLLLTNDGGFIHDIITPSRHVEKVYFCRINGVADESDIEAFAEGITLADGYKCMPAKLEILSSGEFSCEVYVTICEGKFHQVKRMFLARRMQVTYLKRVSIGGVELDNDLETGGYRELTEEELSLLKGQECESDL